MPYRLRAEKAGNPKREVLFDPITNKLIWVETPDNIEPQEMIDLINQFKRMVTFMKKYDIDNVRVRLE